jgi:hypothetical protein
MIRFRALRGPKSILGRSIGPVVLSTACGCQGQASSLEHTLPSQHTTPATEMQALQQRHSSSPAHCLQPQSHIPSRHALQHGRQAPKHVCQAAAFEPQADSQTLASMSLVLVATAGCAGYWW